MPRPADITDTQVEEWRRQLQTHWADEAAKGIKHLRMPPEDVFFAGAWLEEKLRAAGCPPAVMEKIIFANGQRLALTLPHGDVWEVTRKSLARWVETGTYDEPGPQLAVALIEEKYGSLNINTLTEFFKDAGIDTGPIMEILRTVGSNPTPEKLKAALEARYGKIPDVPEDI